MLNRENIGRVLIPSYHQKQAQIEGICTMNGQEYYYINEDYPEEHKGGWGLWTDTDLQRIEGMQETFLAEQKKHDEQEQRQKEAEQKREQERQEAEYLYGFDDGKTPMQRGKLLAVLLKRERVDGKSMTRKDFIIQAAKENRRGDIKRFYGDKQDSRCIYNADGTYYIVTKIEYDFFQFMKDRQTEQSA